MIEELAVTHIVEKKEQPKPDIYIVLWQGNNQLGNGDNSFDNERDIIPLDGTTAETLAGDNPKDQPRGQAPKPYEIKVTSREEVKLNTQFNLFGDIKEKLFLDKQR